MDFNLKEVARRIKDLREAKGYTPEELAKLTGVSVEDYMILESGESDFSFTFIYKCAKACGVEVVDIIEGTSTTLSSFAVTRKGEGMKIVKRTVLSIITSLPVLRISWLSRSLSSSPISRRNRMPPSSSVPTTVRSLMLSLRVPLKYRLAAMLKCSTRAIPSSTTA